MDTAALDNLYRWFAGYVRSFYSDDPQIDAMVRMKEEHTLIVAGHCRDLAAALGLDAAAGRLAEAVGLCHDVGRFKQATLYRTFHDPSSVDHGLLGVEELRAAGVPAGLDPHDWEALSFAVRWHNAAALPDQPDPHLLLHGRIIRDADKLDIYRVVPPGPPAEGCSPRMVDDFLAGKPLYYENIRTADDRKLIMISWLIDVNFPWTVGEIVRRGYVGRLLAALPPSPAAAAVREKIESYVAGFPGPGTEQSRNSSCHAGGAMATKVTAAILVRDDTIFIAKRGPEGRFAHRWEFPGGKIEPGESPQECLAREMAEEFGIEVRVGDFFAESLHTFPGGQILVHAFFCSWAGGSLQPVEHEEYRWVKAAELGGYDFAPADVPIAAKLMREFPAR